MATTKKAPVAKKEEASKALVAFTGNNFQFEKINKAIEKLGTVENLTKEEKENGVELVAEWNKLTIKRNNMILYKTLHKIKIE